MPKTTSSSEKDAFELQSCKRRIHFSFKNPTCATYTSYNYATTPCLGRAASTRCGSQEEWVTLSRSCGVPEPSRPPNTNSKEAIWSQESNLVAVVPVSSIGYHDAQRVAKPLFVPASVVPTFCHLGTAKRIGLS
jgi:hypothetical protein